LFRFLNAEHRLQFLQAAAKWQEAMIHWQDRPSLSFALMAVSCQALKPSDSDERQNCYDVIEALLGKPTVDRIRQNSFPAQQMRSTHLHSGEFHGSELIMMDFMRTYRDPSCSRMGCRIGRPDFSLGGARCRSPGAPLSGSRISYGRSGWGDARTGEKNLVRFQLPTTGAGGRSPPSGRRVIDRLVAAASLHLVQVSVTPVCQDGAGQ
jgi:hypothetical protein